MLPVALRRFDLWRTERTLTEVLPEMASTAASATSLMTAAPPRTVQSNGNENESCPSLIPILKGSFTGRPRRSDSSNADSDVGDAAAVADTGVHGQSVTSSADSSVRRTEDCDDRNGSKLIRDESPHHGRSTFHATLTGSLGTGNPAGGGGGGGSGAEQQQLLGRHSVTGGGIIRTDLQPEAAVSIGATVACILCMECIGTRDDLQRHLLTVHKVKPETLQSILRLADSVSGGHSSSAAVAAGETSPSSSSDGLGSRPVSASKCDQPAGSDAKSEAHDGASPVPMPANAMDSLLNDSLKVTAAGAVRIGTNGETLKLTVEDSKDGTAVPDSDSPTDSDRLCHTCSQTFQTIDALYAHQTELGHLELTQTPTGPGYLCWHRGCRQYFRTAAGVQAHHRETHAVTGEKFRCLTCGLAFQTAARLQAHAHCHEGRSGRSATDCLVCGQQFASVDAVQRHVDTAHAGAGGDLERYRASLAAASSLALLGGAPNALDSFAAVPNQNQRNPSEPSDSSDGATPGRDSADEQSQYRDVVEQSHGNRGVTKFSGVINNDDGKLDENSNSNMAETMETDVIPVISASSARDPMHHTQSFAGSTVPTEGDYAVLKYKCHRCKVAFAKMNQLSAHNRTPAHRQGSKTYSAVSAVTPSPLSGGVGCGASTQAMEKYRDPNRPFKCDVCLESFTQKNILLVHYNSVSHLHRLKQQQQQQQQQQMELIRQQRDAAQGGGDLETGGDGGAFSKQQQWPTSLDLQADRQHGESAAAASPRVEHQRDKISSEAPVKNDSESVTAAAGAERDASGSSGGDEKVLGAAAGDRNSPAKQSQADAKVGHSDMVNSTGFSSPTKALIAACPQGPSSGITPSSSSKTPDSSAVGHTAMDSPSTSSSTHRSHNNAVRADSEAGRPPTNPTNVVQSLPATPTTPMAPMLNQNNLLLQQQQMQMFLADMFQQQLFGHPSLGSFLPMPGMMGQPGMLAAGPQGPLLTAAPQLMPAAGGTGKGSEKQQSRGADSQPHHGPGNNASQSISAGVEVQQSASAHVCQKCNAIFGTVDHLQQHQLVHCAGGTGGRNDRSSAAAPPIVPRQDLATASSNLAASSAYKSRIQQMLLEGFGFECAMQFNEFRQKSVKQSNDAASSQAADPADGGTAASEADAGEKAAGAADGLPGGEKGSNLPELQRCTCSHCSKEFSSIWVLKAHEEEVHHVVLSVDTVASFAREFRETYEKQHAPAPMSDARPPAEPTGNARSSRKNESANLPPPLPALPVTSGMPMPSPDNTSRTPRITSGQFAADLVAMQHAAAQLMQLPLLMGMMSGVGGQPPNAGPPGMMQMMLPLGAELFGLPPGFAAAMMDPTMMMLAQQQRTSVSTGQTAQNVGMGGPISSVGSSQPPPQQQAKSARTRINDDQLAVLRAHFDINNSPSEEQIRAMSEKTGLPPKVIKHWFRNTLFKERQRNKDSPYNFSVPPATTLNLEDYERTAPSAKRAAQSLAEDLKTETPSTPTPAKIPAIGDASADKPSVPSQMAQPEPVDDRSANKPIPRPLPPAPQLTPGTLFPELSAAAIASMVQISPGFSPLPTLVGPGVTPTRLPTVGPIPVPGVVGGSADGSSGGHGSSERRANRTRFTNHQIRVLHEFFEKNAYPKDDELEALSRMLDLSPRVIVVWFQNARQKVRKNNENQPMMSLPPSTSTSDLAAAAELGHSSAAANAAITGVLGSATSALLPQTPSSSSSAAPLTSTPNGADNAIEHRCKRCPASFRTSFELIKHEQTVCFKDEVGGAASASGVASFAAESDSSQDDRDGSENDASQSSMGSESHSAGTGAALTTAANGGSSGIEYRCDRCDAAFSSLQSWNEHQSVHASASGGPTLSLVCKEPSTSTGAGGEKAADKPTGNDSAISTDELGGQRSWASDDAGSDDPRSGSGTGSGGDKRMRTTILPEQLDYLYHKYQADCNPSRKQLDAIAAHVGLKKRVVQVWFQNTRARERKGQYRAHQQLIHKRCPFCKALFRARTALEAHLATKHPDEMAHTDVNVDNIPDEPADSVAGASSNLSSPPVAPVLLTSPKPVLPNGPFGGAAGAGGIPNQFLMAAAAASASPAAAAAAASMGRASGPGDLLQANMQRLYEDSFRRYINELSHASHPVKIEQPTGRFPPTAGDFQAEAMAAAAAAFSSSASLSSAAPTKTKADDAPLDLSTSSTNRGGSSSSADHHPGRGGPVAVGRDDPTSFANQRRGSSQEDTRSESRSETNDEFSVDYSNAGDGGGSSPASPGGMGTNSGHSSKSQQHQIPGASGTPGGSGYIPGKRYRTQMSSMQIRVMKAIFAEYRTPTMSECEALGREISLPRRVVQVWFQNARAKEKKIGLPCAGDVQSGAGSTGGSSTGQPVVLMNPTSESCDLCGIRYTAQHTIQDHLFTRTHVDRVKAMVCSQRDAAGPGDDSASGRGGSSAGDSASRNRKFSSSARMDVDSHLPNQSRPSIPNGSLMMTSPGPNTSHSSGNLSDKRSALSSKAKHEQPESNKGNQSNAGDMAAIFGGAGASGPLGANIVGSAAMAQLFGGPYAAAGFPVPGPGDVVGMMPYFYPGLAGFYPGAAMGMPFMQPPMMPGPESMFMLDPANFGTPLAMLQIPGRAIQRIQEKLTSDSECTLTYYSQDCRHFSELRKVVSADDAAVARRASVDVGYICRRCHIVYPGRSTCAAHQEAVCYRDAASGSAGSTIPAGSIVKLEQMQYECAACRGSPRFSTAAEYKSHCGHDSHRSAASAWLRSRSQNRPSSSAAQQQPAEASSAAPAGASTPLSSANSGK